MLGICFYTGPQRHPSGFFQTQKNKRVDRRLPELRLAHEPELPPPDFTILMSIFLHLRSGYPNGCLSIGRDKSAKNTIINRLQTALRADPAKWHIICYSLPQNQNSSASTHPETLQIPPQ
jgi:hypothetical protein